MPPLRLLQQLQLKLFDVRRIARGATRRHFAIFEDLREGQPRASRLQLANSSAGW
jgi:hypothetical protein